MSVELISVLIAILAIGATLGGLILTSNRGLRLDIRQDMARLESRLDGRISGLESQFGELRERMAKLEGLLEGFARGHQRASQGQLRNNTMKRVSKFSVILLVLALGLSGHRTKGRPTPR